MTLVRSSPAFPPAPAAEADSPAPGPLGLVREVRSLAPQPPALTPDVDELTTQVLRRIERRAIAQRERLGGVV
jgi:hypothetical protein